jgi:hypothetical protein
VIYTPNLEGHVMEPLHRAPIKPSDSDPSTFQLQMERCLFVLTSDQGKRENIEYQGTKWLPSGA